MKNKKLICKKMVYQMILCTLIIIIKIEIIAKNYSTDRIKKNKNTKRKDNKRKEKIKIKIKIKIKMNKKSNKNNLLPLCSYREGT